MDIPKYKHWFSIAFFYLVVVAIAGFLIRLDILVQLPIPNVRNIIHAHSHTALLGWVYSAIYIAIIAAYLPSGLQSRRIYKIIFWLTQISVLGMLVTFTMKGYWMLSIAFSTIHILLFYWFLVHFLSDLKKGNIEKQITGAPIYFLKAGLFFLFLSTLGPWALGIISAKGMAGTDIYFQAIYYYLHFQYNGFFVFVILALWFWTLSINNVPYPKKLVRKLFPAFCILTIVSYSLSLLGFEIPGWLKVIAFISGFLQLVIISIVFGIMHFRRSQLFRGLTRPMQLFFSLAAILLFLKFLLQWISAMPTIGVPVFVTKDIVIGYLHLVLLGFTTLSIWVWMSANGIFKVDSPTGVLGMILFIAGFAISEFILFYPILTEWFHLPHITHKLFWLAVSSGVLLGGLVFMFVAHIKGSIKSAI